MGTITELGLLLIGSRPFDSLAAMAQRAEENCFTHVWVPDERFYRDPFVVAGAIAGRTHHVRIGPCVIDPYTRLPELATVALASLDEISGGRACVAIGSGVSGFRELGVVHVPPPVVAVRRAVNILRTLWGGASADAVRLGFHPIQEWIPVFIAADGPRMLRLAGEIGDGVILQARVTPALCDAALWHVREGLEAAGRSPSGLKTVFRVDVALDERLPVAYDLLRHRVAKRLVAATPQYAILEQAGVEIGGSTRRVLADVGYTTDRAVLERIGQDHVSDEMVDCFCIAATATTLGTRLERLVELGADHIIVNPVTANGADEILVAAGAWVRGRVSSAN